MATEVSEGASTAVDPLRPARRVPPLMGPSGSGKTTFFNMIGVRLDFPTGGSIHLGGRNLKQLRATLIWALPALPQYRLQFQNL